MSKNFSEKDIKKVAKGTGTTLIGSSIGGGLNFLSQVIIARFLGVEIFGLYALGLAAVRISQVIARLGLDTGGMRFISMYKSENPSKLKGVLFSSTGISLLSSTLIGLMLYLLSGEISQKIFRRPEIEEILHLFAFSIPFITVTTVISSLLRGFHTAKYTVYMSDLIQPATNTILIMGFHYAGFGLSGVIYALILSHMIAFIIGISYLNRLFPEFKNRSVKPVYEIKKLISYSIPLLSVGFMNYFFSWTDILMLGFLSTTKDVGIYRAASQVPFIMTMFLSATNSLYAPLVADLYYKGEVQRLSNIYKSTTRWTTYAVFPILVFILLSPREIMMIFGKGYVETGYIVLIVLSFGQLINCMTGGAGFTLIMTGRQNIQLLILVASVLINIALNIILIPRYGSLGAALATSIAISLANITKVVVVFKYIKAHPFSRHMLKFTMFSIILILLLMSIRSYMFFPAQISFVIKLIIVLISYAFFFFLAGIKDEDKYLLQKVKARLVI